MMLVPGRDDRWSTLVGGFRRSFEKFWKEWSPALNYIKLFLFVTYKSARWARVFVLGKPFQPSLRCVGEVRCQFHQYFSSSFFVWKFFAQLLCAYKLGLQFFGERILVQKLLIKCWWNWHQEPNRVQYLSSLVWRLRASPEPTRVNQLSGASL